MALPALPDEVLSLVCQELGHEKDFRTLYRCALSSHALADPALRTLYQYHEHSQIFLQSDDIEIRRAGDRETVYRRWTVLWRSIILSCLDGNLTYKPYCRYMRMLDFRNLGSMLEDDKFARPKTQADFFQGPLKQFHFPKQEYKRKTVDVVATINAVGDTVTLTTPQVEEITGHLSPGFLPRWISRVRQLQTLVLWRGDALVNGAGRAIAEHCEHFRNLTVHAWTGEETDAAFARFLAELRPQTLGHVEMISYNTVGRASMAALSQHHHASLRVLKLGSLLADAVLSLGRLHGCTELHTLVLEGGLGSARMEQAGHADGSGGGGGDDDVFTQVASWLSSCAKLRDLTVKKLHDAPKLLSIVLASPHVRLRRLSVEGYTVNEATTATATRLFHGSLAEQRATLESLSLKGSGEDATPHDLDVMVEAVSRLDRLRVLELKDVSDEFEERHVVRLARSLPRLEDLWTSGGRMRGPPVLSALTPAHLPHLRTLTLYALTQFSCDEIIDFLARLDPVAQHGFNLSLMAADPHRGRLTDDECDLIREFVGASLNGRFDYVPWREAETSESDDD